MGATLRLTLPWPWLLRLWKVGGSRKPVSDGPPGQGASRDPRKPRVQLTSKRDDPHGHGTSLVLPTSNQILAKHGVAMSGNEHQLGPCSVLPDITAVSVESRSIAVHFSSLK